MSAFKPLILALFLGLAVVMPLGLVQSAGAVSLNTSAEVEVAVGALKDGAPSEQKAIATKAVLKSEAAVSTPGLWQRFRLFTARWWDKLTGWRAQPETQDNGANNQNLPTDAATSTTSTSPATDRRGEGGKPAVEERPGTKMITLANNNTTLTLTKGERFMLKLGQDFDWKVNVENSGVIQRINSMMATRGTQGLFVAEQPGTVVISAVGDPLCRKSLPACGQPSIVFKLTVEVTGTVSTNPPVMCTMEYKPVCGLVQVQCIRAPCPPLWQTFSNRCLAEVAGVKEIKPGACDLTDVDSKTKNSVEVGSKINLMVR